MSTSSGDYFNDVVKSSYTRYCTLKSILILRDLEYLTTVNTRQLNVVTCVSWRQCPR